MPMGLSAELPYPALNGIEKDEESVRILAPAYAAKEGELTATLQYIYQSFIFCSLSMAEYAKTLQAIAVAEMHHLDLLGRMILKMGAYPIYSACPPIPFNFYSASAVSYSVSPQKMIMDDIRAETEAIRCYERIAGRLKNEQAAAVISRIILDERLHLDAFKRILGELVAPNCPEN